MSIAMIGLLFGAGFFSGVVNAIAGGGTFLTFGALTLVGLPPIAANATSSIVQFPGYTTSTIAYWPEIRARLRSTFLLAAISAVGALAGALVLLSLDNPSFARMVPWLLLAATLVFAAGPWLKPKALNEHPSHPLASAVSQFFMAVYGGFFGAGMGIMMLAILGVTLGGNYHRLNALKNLLSIVIATVAIAVFVSGGVVVWSKAVVMIPAVALGGYSGVWAARRVPQSLMRAIVVAVGLGLTVYYFLKV